jgi:hypothetical protein
MGNGQQREEAPADSEPARGSAAGRRARRGGQRLPVGSLRSLSHGLGAYGHGHLVTGRLYGE